MPNRYLPSALTDMVEEVHTDLLDDAPGKGDDQSADDYVPEYEALVRMLRPEYQREFKERTGHGGGDG